MSGLVEYDDDGLVREPFALVFLVGDYIYDEQHSSGERDTEDATVVAGIHANRCKNAKTISEHFNIPIPELEGLLAQIAADRDWNTLGEGALALASALEEWTAA